jgi:hypothetical protein
VVQHAALLQRKPSSCGVAGSGKGLRPEEQA